MVDEPVAVSRADRAHVSTCPECSARLAGVNLDRQAVGQLLAHDAVQPDLVRARQRLNGRLQVGRSRWPRPAIGIATNLRWLWGVGLAAMVAGALAFTPAPNLFTIFQPQQVTTISVLPGELRTLPNLRQFGYVHFAPNLQARQFSSLGAAQTDAGFHVRQPASVPAWVPRQTAYQVLPAETSSISFSRSKAAAFAMRHGERLPAMPSAINGTTISLHTHAAVITVYGRRQDIPSLVVGQTTAPTIASSGASLRTIETYLLRVPGISKQLVRQIESIGNPATTLPIPIPVNWAYAQHVTVQGHQAVLVGDNTGVASIVVWEDHGVIYGVAGALTQGQVLQIANSLR